MFQFSTLLTRHETGTSRRRPSAADSEALTSTAGANDEDSFASPAGQCVSDRVRRDLDDQMHRLSELLDRVESLEFDREAEAADIFALGKTDRSEELAGQPRIFEEIEGTPGTDDGFPGSYSTADGNRAVFSTERTGCDESVASSVVLTPFIPLSKSEIESVTAPSVICNSPGAAVPEKQPCREPIATETGQIEMPARDDAAPDPTSPCRRKPTIICREAERPVTPSSPANAPIASGVVQDYRLTPPRAITESTPVHETSDSSVCLTMAASDFGESLGRPSVAVDYPLASELTGRSQSETDNLNSSVVEDQTSSSTPDTNDSREPHETPQSFDSEPFGSAGVHMDVVNDIPDCPTPTPIQALASSHSRVRSRAAQVEATKHDSPIVPLHRSLRRALSIESPPASDTVSPQPLKFGGSQIWNILAVIGGLLTVAALAYVASDLASWFGPMR